MRLPITPLELEKLLKTKFIDFTALNNIANNVSRGGDISSYINVTEFNEIFNAIRKGYQLRVAAVDKVVNLLYAQVSEIVSDDFKAVELGYIYEGNIVTLTLTKFSNDLFLDNKTIKAL